MTARLLLFLAALLLAFASRADFALEAPAGRPAAIVDLRTQEGVALMGGGWRWHDAAIVEVDHRGPGPDLRASGAPLRTHDLVPHAGAADFDDSAWEKVAPESLEQRRSTGKLCFGWYRTAITIPPRVGRLDPTGMTVVFELVMDDYAEVWVDGRLPLVLGQAGGALPKGFNAPNRVVLTRDARPGQRFEIAVLGANGPLSSPPDNFLWVRSATLELVPAERAAVGTTVPMEVERRSPELDTLVPPGARLERVASGFEFTEGPVWVRDANVRGGGYLLFSDPNANRIYRWTPDGEVSIYRTKSGYAGLDVGEFGQPGSNGLALDPQGRLTIDEHGNRRVTRLEKTGALTVLADRYEGRRLNSPNDLVYRSDGALYFTDPPFGLPKFHQDSRKELPFSGVYRLADGKLTLLTKELDGPNGIAFSPDERFLYVTNWDVKKKVVMRYPVLPDGGVGPGEVFFDMTSVPGEIALDGLEVDREGHLYVSGPGGVWVIAPDGRHLGTLRGPELPANFAFGDEDGRTLYMTARTGIYRLRVGVPGRIQP